MGKNNRARRAAKAKQRKERAQRPPPHDSGFRLSPSEVAAGFFDLAATRLRVGDEAMAAHFVDRLAELAADLVDGEVERGLLRALHVLWDNGWQPAEIVRQVRRSGTAAAARLTASAVLADHADRAPDTLHSRWAEQVEEFRARTGPGSVPRVGWFGRWQAQEGQDRRAALETAALAFERCTGVGPIAELLPPPGRAPGRGAAPVDRARAVDDPVLARVRALLAQAESTTFPAEAEAFTAKAQALMTRHAIDHALLGATDGGERPGARRIAIDDPYVDAKSYLLHVVADASRCRSVFSERYAFVTVIGFEDDLAATELLFTSLLVQAQVALTAEARHAAAGSRPRSRSFRSSFLVAYAARIGERLAEVNDGVIREVADDARRGVLPVLAARRHEVDEVVDELFGELHNGTVRAGWDPLGQARGKLAADRAQLRFAHLPAAAGDGW